MGVTPGAAKRGTKGDIVGSFNEFATDDRHRRGGRMQALHASVGEYCVVFRREDQRSRREDRRRRSAVMVAV